MPVIRESYTSHDELIVDHSKSGRAIVVRDAQITARAESLVNQDRPIIVRIRVGHYDHFVAVYENGIIGEANDQMKQKVRWEDKDGNTAPQADRVYITAPREYMGMLDHNATGSRTFDIIGYELDRAPLVLCTRCYLDPSTMQVDSDDDQAIDSMDHDLHTEKKPLLCDGCGHMIQPGTGPYIGCDDDITDIRAAIAAKSQDDQARDLLRKRIRTLDQLRGILQSCRDSAARMVAEDMALMPDHAQVCYEHLGGQHGYDLALAFLAGIDSTSAIINRTARMIAQRDVLLTGKSDPDSWSTPDSTYRASYIAALDDSINAVNDLLLDRNH